MSTRKAVAPEPGPFVSMIETVSRVLVWVTALILVFLMAIIVLDSIARTVFWDPLVWVYELTEILTVILMLGGALALAAGWDEGRSGPFWAVLRLIFLFVLALPAILVLIYSASNGLDQSLSYGELTYGPLSLPAWPRGFIIILAALALALQILAEIGRCFVCLGVGQWPFRGGAGWSVHGLTSEKNMIQRRQQALDDIWS